MNQSSHRNLLKWGLALSCWLMVIGLVYLADTGQVGPYFGVFYQYPGGDKIGHFLLMGTLSFLTNLALGGKSVSWRGRDWLIGTAVVWSVVFLEECSQYWFAVRTCSWLDLLADTLGILLGGQLAIYCLVKTSSDRVAGAAMSVKSRGPRSPESKI